MKAQPAWQILREAEELRVPDSIDHWPIIRERMMNKQAAPHTKGVPLRRLGWAFVAVVLLLAFGAGAYAVGNLMSEATKMEAGLQHIEKAKLYQTVNQTRTIGGITVTLERVYADANRVVIGTTVKGPGYLADQREISHRGDFELTDDQGHVLTEIWGVGQGSQPDPKGGGRGVSYLASFDTSAVPGEPQELGLRLVVNVSTNVVPTPASCPVGKDCGGPGEPPTATAGPFTFDFAVPVLPGQILKVGQTVEKSGATLTLDRVIITPSQTRVVVCVRPPNQERDRYDRWVPDGELNTGVVRAGWMGNRFLGFDAPHNGCYNYREGAYYGDQHGEWTFTVNKLYGQIDGHPEKEKVLPGPWVFQFRVP